MLLLMDRTRHPDIYMLHFSLSRVGYVVFAWLGKPADVQDLVLAPSVQCFQKQTGRIKTLAVACSCLGGHLDALALASKFDAWVLGYYHSTEACCLLSI